MTGPERVAVLLLSLPEDKANALLSRFSDDEIHKVTKAIVSLTDATPTEVEGVLSEFMQSVSKTQGIKGSWDQAERLLSNVLPEEKLGLIKSNIHTHRTLWSNIPMLSIEFFTSYLEKESNQTIAIILQRIPDSGYVSKLLASFEKERAVDIIYRMIALPNINQSVIENLENTLRKVVQDFSTGGTRFESVADLLSRMTADQEESILENIASVNATTAEQIKRFMYKFTDIIELDDKGIQIILRNVERTKLVIALKGAKEELAERFLKNMSARAAKLMRDEMEAADATEEEIQEYQAEIAQTTKDLIRDGEIRKPGK